MTKKKILPRLPARFGAGTIEAMHFDKLRTFIAELRVVESVDYIILEQAAKCYGIIRRLEEDITDTGNYLKYEDGTMKGKNPLLSDYKSISASYSAYLRDLGITMKDRATISKLSEDEETINKLLD